MKCADKKMIGLKIPTTLAVALMMLAMLVGVPQVSLAQAPVVAAPAVPVPPSVKEVSPVTVPGAAPLATADADDDLDLMSADEGSVAVPGAPIGARADQVGRMAMPQPMSVGASAATASSSANIPSAVTDVVGDLKRAEKNVTLEDVARAQDALARLDLLLGIEKKINEIEKTREERKSIGKSLSREGGSGFNQIPASALSLPLSGNSGGMAAPFRSAASSVAKPVVATPPAPKATTDSYKVEQINGSNGRYRAVVSDSGKKNTLSVGDKLGAFTVTNISATGVTLTNDKDRKVLTVESDGVPMVVRPR